ncbi:scavenger receptor cysteine-rich domain-containing protein DMBT1-like [Hemitrygon akajei]|uniref:scavenger receptor cysteine-rich domain-containing protein DMBT1-like n=1 Tax=Hemitrygon akajei TaxID=2704970 RepID=UPI003BF9D42E
MGCDSGNIPDTPRLAELSLRLFGGNNNCSGRLEIFFNNTWGTVCDDSWNLADADVVCRQLGCGSALWTTVAEKSNQGVGDIWLDKVKCKGSESLLSSCPSSPLGQHDCDHKEDVFVVCSGAFLGRVNSPDIFYQAIYEEIENAPCIMKLDYTGDSGSPGVCQADQSESGKSRLMDGGSRCAGKLEVNYQDIWGAVHDDHWDLSDAAVVCRQLGCGKAVDAPRNAYFGKSQTVVVTWDFKCHGNEASLRECQSVQWGIHGRGHFRDAGVICSDHRAPRLVSGYDECSGRLEVQFGKIWGTVCDLHWDIEDANVVCHQLQCGVAVSVLGGAYFGEGDGTIQSGVFDCQGNESSLMDCTFSSRNDSCNHTNDPNVLGLWAHSQKPLHFLRSSISHDVSEGCNVLDSTASRATKIRHPEDGLVFQAASLTYRKAASLEYARAGHISIKNRSQHESMGHDWLTGRTGALAVWKFCMETSGGHFCDEYFSLEDASVVCEQLQCGAVKSTPKNAYFGEGKGPLWKDNYRCLGNESRLTDCPVSAWDLFSCSHGNDASLICTDENWSLRLSDEGSRCNGRVEVYDNGIWRRVHDKFWSISEAKVVCEQLLCNSAISAYNSSRYRENQRPVWVTDIQCEGNESHLQNCSNTKPNRSSSDVTGVGVQCSGHLQLRLSGSDDTCAGRLEIYYNGAWGTVCDDSWNLIDSNVVCRQLGCGYALEEEILDYCERSTGEVWLDEVRCSGNESYLWECPSAPWGEHDCSHKEDVIVTCSEHKELCLMNGDRRCEGRVEVRYNGTWGTVCSEKLDENAANLICKQMKCGSLISIKYDYQTYGKGSGPIWLDEIKCSTYESTLWQCRADPWGQHNCDHNEDAGLACEELQLRLSGDNANCSGRLEILFNNTWGTVCDDSWDLADANVVCRELGCGSAVWTTVSDKITQSVGDISLDEVNCKGSESFLSSCPSSPLGQHDCDHKEDVFVSCSGMSRRPDSYSDSGEVLRDGVIPDVFYQALYEEIETIPHIKKSDYTGDSGSQEAMKQAVDDRMSSCCRPQALVMRPPIVDRVNILLGSQCRKRQRQTTFVQEIAKNSLGDGHYHDYTL